MLIDARGRIHRFDDALDPNTLWFSPTDAIDAAVWHLPGTDTELADTLRAVLERARRYGSSRAACESEDLNGRRRCYTISCFRQGDPDDGRTLFHVLIADRTEERAQALVLERARTSYRGLFLESRDAIACVEYPQPGVSLSWTTQRQIEAYFDARIADCNDAYARLIRCSDRREVIGRKVRDLIPGTDAGIDLQIRIIESGYSLHGWYSPLVGQAEESFGPVHHVVSTADFSDSRVVRSWNVFRDVTDKLGEIDAVTLGAERHESLLLAEEAYFCFEFDPPIDTRLPAEEQARRMRCGTLIECNEAYAQTCGAESPEAIIGMTLEELIPHSMVADEDARLMKQMVEYVASGYKLQNARQEITLPDGSRRVCVVNGRGVVRNGQLTHHWAMMLDLTEREAQVLDLQRSEARFERIAQHSPALIYRLSLGEELACEFVNDAIDSISGYPRDHARINDVVLHEVFAMPNLELLLSQIETGDSGPVLTHHMHRAGNIVYLEHRVVPVRDSQGQLKCIEGVALDVTQRLQSQQQLQTALKEISKLSDALQQENVQLRDDIRSARRFDLIVGNSPRFSRVIELATRAAPTDSTVLILGETGTGKELFARSIHQSSARSDQPMVSVNCAALPPTLIESELFGHTKGAFTGADDARVGRFELADGGTLFLDEIGELSLDLQGKLLRVVQEGELQRLGDNRTVRVDVRLIAATNADLAAAVERGEFRADLYYRLNVFPLVIPPLRERTEDIPILANHFAIKHCHRLGRTFEAISPELLRALMKHDWPGNVRELESAIERSIIVSAGGTLQPVELRSERSKPEACNVDELTQSARVLHRSLQDAERHHIVRTLEDSSWVIEGPEGAASRLGIAPSTLRSKMKKLGVIRPTQDESGLESLPRRQLH